MNLVTIFDPGRKFMLIFCLFYIINVTILDASYVFSTDKAMVKSKFVNIQGKLYNLKLHQLQSPSALPYWDYDALNYDYFSHYLTKIALN